MITYQKEPFYTVYDTAMDVILDNLDENMKLKGKLEAGIDPVSYQNMEDFGFLETYTARDEKGIIGYAVFFVSPATHYLNTKQAVNDAVYIHPDFRGLAVAQNLLEFAEEQLKALGVHIMYVCFKTKNELVNKLGYSLEEYKYTKYIGE